MVNLKNRTYIAMYLTIIVFAGIYAILERIGLVPYIQFDYTYMELQYVTHKYWWLGMIESSIFIIVLFVGISLLITTVMVKDKEEKVDMFKLLDMIYDNLEGRQI